MSKTLEDNLPTLKNQLHYDYHVHSAFSTLEIDASSTTISEYESPVIDAPVIYMYRVCEDQRSGKTKGQSNQACHKQ